MDATRSKRQRLRELVKATRDVYIPTFSSTITHLASEATTRALGYECEDAYVNKDVQGAQIIVYPHFTRTDGDVYYTQAHGWVFSTDGSSRKKRIVFALAKQLARSNNAQMSDVTAGQLDEQINSLNGPDSEKASLNSGSSDYATGVRRTGTSSSSASSEYSTNSTASQTDDVLKERIAAFVNKSLGSVELVITIAGEEYEQITTVELLTDANGNFNTDIMTPYKPTVIQVALAVDETVVAYRDTMFPGKSDYAVVSDIDDTIKRTGVCGDKRSIFRNTFAENIENWEIPGAADCYRYLEQKFDVSFFYVSNSPYQLYSNLLKFFLLFEFPKGSMYLKKYSGNFLNSFMEASHARKKAPLERIMQHFSSKRFFLIGDTSEQDMEAYVDIARQHPDRVAAIYLRVAEGSMTTETFKTLNDIINKRSIPLHETPAELKVKFEALQASEQNLINLDDEVTPGVVPDELANVVLGSKKATGQNEDLEQGDNDEFFARSPLMTGSGTPINVGSAPPTPVRKPPPVVPRKPTFLQGAPSSAGSTPSVPPLPRRPVPAAPPRSNPNSVPPLSFNTNDTFTSEDTIDWIGRLLTSMLVLQKVGWVRIKIFNEFSDIQDEMATIIKNKQ